MITVMMMSHKCDNRAATKRRIFTFRKRKRKLALSLGETNFNGKKSIMVKQKQINGNNFEWMSQTNNSKLTCQHKHNKPDSWCYFLMVVVLYALVSSVIVTTVLVNANLSPQQTRTKSANQLEEQQINQNFNHIKQQTSIVKKVYNESLLLGANIKEGVNFTAVYLNDNRNDNDDKATNNRWRFKRSASQSSEEQQQRQQTGDLTRVVAVGGQWIELQCPLASELLAIANSGAPKSQPDHAIVWLKDSNRLSQLDPRQKVSSTNGSLVLVSAQPQIDEGSYECGLVNLAREDQIIKSHRFELRLVVAPKIAPFEFPSEAQVGMKVMLTCSVLQGQQPISFVWLKDNQIISSDSQPQNSLASGSGSGGGNKAVGVARHHHHQVANSLSQLHQQQLIDKLSLSAQVSIAPSSPLLEHSSNSLATSGVSSRQSEYVILMGQVGESNGRGKTTTSDQLDGNTQLLPLLSDSNMKIRQSDDYSILSIERLELKHAGKYSCSVQNEAARTSHSSQLIINAPPTFTIEPKDGDLVSGHSALIDCAASGHPRPTIIWLRARESSGKQWDYVPIYDNSRYNILPNGTLSIANATQREQGFYLCSAKNGFGPELTKLIKISVHEPAKFTSKYKTVEVKIEERANIVCVAGGELPNSIEWFDKDGSQIQRTDKRFIIEDNPHDVRANLDSQLSTTNATISMLMIARTSRSDSGHYTCQATNKYGTDKMITNLLVQDVPDKVTELKVTNVTASTISIRWQMGFTGNSAVSSYLVQYQSDDPLDDLLIMAQPTPTNNQLQSRTRGSQPQQNNDQQQQQVSSTTNNQELLQSNTQTQPSLASSLKAALDALNVMSVSSLGSADEAIDRTLVELTVEDVSTHLVVKDLSPFCVYRLRLAAINKIGLGEFSDWIRAKTEEVPPSGSALKISAAATGPNSIKITWSPPDRRTWNGQLIGFNIAYRPIDSSFESNKTVEWTAPSLQSLVLDANRQTQDSASDSATSTAANSARKVTQDLTSKATNSDDTSSKNQTSVAKIQAEKSAKTPNSYYNLREHLRQLLALQQQELVAHLTNLQRSTTYLVWIQAINNRGPGPQSHAISIKTLDDVPPSAPAIRIQSTSSSSITIAWSMLSNFVSSANQYSLFYRRMPQAGSQLINGRTDPNNMSLPLNQFMINSESNVNQPVNGYMEAGPFIERTITSQLLLMAGNMFMGSPDQEPSLEAGGSSFLHSHSQSQHYQQFVYTLDQLDCGSVYELYMTTRNSVGKSEPSPVVTTRTLGEPPLAPSNRNSLFSRIGINEVALNFASWLTGGCPLTHVTVRYKQTANPIASASSSANSNQNNGGLNNNNGSSSSFAVSWPITTNVPLSILNSINKEQQQIQSSQQRIASTNYQQSSSTSNANSQGGPKVIDESPMPNFLLKNLQPSTSYELEIVAHNSAGHTTAQYEFVTANSNGTRAGYSRREGVFRIDHRGATINPNQPLDGQSQSIDQPAPFTNQSGVGTQIVPLILLILCFICLIISSTFCYYRLTGSWKRNGRRSSEDDRDGDVGGDANSKGVHCQSSPSSYGKSSSIWRPNGRSTIKLRQSSDNDSNGQDSPSVLHHCIRDPASAQHLLTNSNLANQNTGTYSQSVSMRDFNLISPPVGGHVNAATLNFKNNRSSIRPIQEINKAGTLRARLISDDSMFAGNCILPPSNQNPSNNETQYGQLSQDQVCPLYAGSCDQKHTDLYGQATATMRTIYSTVQQPQASSNYSNGAQIVHYASHNQCNYPTNGDNMQQETSWTTYGNQHVNCSQPSNLDGHPTNYAIPTSTFPPIDQQFANNNNTEYHCQPDNCGQNGNASIEACIQQLIDQQHCPQRQTQQQSSDLQQEHLNQQQYAIIVNQKNTEQQKSSNKYIYDQNGSNQLILNDQVKLPPPPTMMSSCGQSVIDSSSSSSGIDVATNLDCGATTCSGGSQNGYMTSKRQSLMSQTRQPNNGDEM